MRFPIAAWCGLALLAGCTSEPASSPDPVDGPRLVSLAPHLTELVYTAGAGDNLVGVVAYSDFPPAARTVPVIGDAFRIDPERLAAVAPDLVLAWEGGNPQATIERIRTLGYRVESLRADTLDDVAANLETIGRLTGRHELASDRAAAYRDGLAELRERHAGSSRLGVFYQISPQPLYTVGGPHPISDMIDLCGGANVFAELTQLAPVVSVEDVVLRNPDVIVSTDDTDGPDRWRRWGHLTAVARDNFCTIDPSLVSRASVRMLDGAKALCACLDAARLRTQ